MVIKTYYEVVEDRFPSIKERVIAVMTSSGPKDLSLPADEEVIKPLTFDDQKGKEIFWHTSAHLLAQAVKEIFPDVKLATGPAIEEGFFYDFHKEEPFKEEEIVDIEKKMKELAKRKQEIHREEIGINRLVELYKENPLKEEIIEDIRKEGEDKATIYRQGDFFDLCRGPHLQNTGLIKGIKLTKVSGAYWKGDRDREQLQRIYGITFPSKEELKEYLRIREEAAKRDHRKIGKELSLFSFHDEAPGMPFFHDRGSFIWNQLVGYAKEMMISRGYEINKTPLLLNNSLWLRSGHWDHYKENMYFTKIDKADFAVKPMNCPGNILVYKTRLHSYRELPIRAGEFGLVHRHELSGVLSGLFRARAFTQDDAHIFCTEKDVEGEIRELLEMIDEIYSTFGFEYHMELSTRPEKAMGSTQMWDFAEDKLKAALENSGKEFEIKEGEGAFYGPKIDFHLKDALSRTWQCGTIQLDFQMPEKFDLTYEGEDGKKHRPVMIHRAILGSVERFMGILIEHFGGKLPFWINPNQIIILPMADRHIEYAKSVHKNLSSSGLRVDIDKRVESINKKIRMAQLQRYGIMVVIGDKEVDERVLSIRTRENKKYRDIELEDLKKRLLSALDSKATEISF